MAATSERQLAEQLARVPLFAQASAKQRRSIAKLGKVASRKEGTTIIKQGSKGAGFFLILDGMVDVVRDGSPIARLNVGDFVGEMALLTNAPRNADVIAAADTSVFTLTRPGLAAALKADPNMAMALLEAVALRTTT